MADIGSTLRDTRIRKKIDIGSVESATKIRAKYLRAIENEEWGILPGPTYVKSFIRTYAEFLGLDPFVLIEEFNARFEEPEELELPAFTRDTRGRQPDVRRIGRPSRGAIAGLLVAAFIVFLLILGLQKDDKPKGNESASPVITRDQPVTKTPQRSEQPKPASRRVSLQIVPASEVWVCVVDSNGKTKVNGVVLNAGDKQGPFHSKSFKVTVGNGGGDMVINGKRKNVPDTSEPIGYSITGSRVKLLSDAQRPSCGA